jgi:hypothetical protein
MNGISALDDECKKMHGKSFTECTAEQRHDLLMKIEKEAKAFNQNLADEDSVKREAHEKANSKLAWKDQTEFEDSPLHYYTMMKQLTLLGFFSSKTGMTETLRHVAVPTKYDGAFPYAKGDKAWAE